MHKEVNVNLMTKIMSVDDMLYDLADQVVNDPNNFALSLALSSMKAHKRELLEKRCPECLGYGGDCDVADDGTTVSWDCKVCGGTGGKVI